MLVSLAVFVCMLLFSTGGTKLLTVSVGAVVMNGAEFRRSWKPPERKNKR